MGSRKRKYLFLINSLIPGGAERSLVDLLHPMASEGITPIILCLADKEIGFKGEVEEMGFDLRFTNATGLLGRVREVRSMIRQECPDLLHTTLFDADVVGRLAAIGTGVRVMTTLANTTYDDVRVAGDVNLSPTKVMVARGIDGFTARHFTTHFHAVSEAAKESAVTHLGISEGRVTVVHRGRDSIGLGRRTQQRTAEARARLGLEPGAEVILTVGRHEYQKGHLHLLAAFEIVAQSRPDARLVIAGREGNATADLHARAAELGLLDKVQFLGHRSDVPELMAAADVFAFPSLWEGLGGVLIEALALEIPIICSNLPATREVVGGDGTSGLLVPPGDESALARNLEKLLDDEQERRRVTSRSRERFEERFLLADRSHELLALMESVARG
jgi:glycosyltransferase involved in cell wall biosynthesis